MSTDLHREQPLFDRTLCVEVTASNADTRHSDLVVRIIGGTRQPVQGQVDKIVHFEVTDDSDPYFLYMLDVGEQDFHSLKREQSILVDFSLFPGMFIQLLDHCAAASANVGEEEGAEANFIARIDQSTGVFSIIEANNFKQITHISIQMRPGNDASIKAYLASRLNHTCAVVRRQAREVDTLGDQLSAEKSMRRDMADELRELRTHRDVDMQSIKAAHSEEISRLQVKASDALEYERTCRSEEVASLRAGSDSGAAAAAARIAELEMSLGTVSRASSQAEFRVKELERDLEGVTADRERLLMDAKENDVEHRELVGRNGVLEREVARLGAKTEALVDQMADKDAAVARSGDLLKAADDARQGAEEKIGLYHNSLQALKDKLTNAVGEINKGNQLISSMQTDAQRSREIIGSKNEVLRRQEQTIGELRGKIGECDRRVERAEDSEAAKDTQLATVRRELNDARARLKEGAEVIVSNQEVITWLNRELSRYQLSGPGTAAPGHGSPDSVSAWGSASRGVPVSAMKDFTPDSLGMKTKQGQGTPDTADTGTTRETGQSSTISAISGIGMGNGVPTHKTMVGAGEATSGTYKDSYEYLRTVDGLGGMEDVDMEALGLGGGGGSYYDGLLDCEGVRAGAPPSGVMEAGGAIKYSWQAADFGLDQ
jgi:spindle assembly abnormal protein 6